LAIIKFFETIFLKQPMKKAGHKHRSRKPKRTTFRPQKPIHTEGRPATTPRSTPSRWTIIAVSGAVGIATLIAFWGIWQNDFINFDDNEYITENPYVQQGLTSESVKWAFTTGEASNWHPLTWLSHMLDCQLFALNPAGHHIINLILHIANTLLLLWVLYLMTGSLWRSAFVAGLFALHPLHVESVAWASERKDVLSSLFWMLTMITYVRYVRTSRVIWYILSLLSIALGLMAKPMLVTLPFVLLLLDYWPLDRLSEKQKSAVGLLKEKIPFFVIVAVSCTITFIVQQAGQAVKGLYMLPLKYRIGNAIISYIAYIGKMFFPINLAVFYPHSGDSLSWPKAALAAITLIAICLIIFVFLKKHRYLTVGWLWYLGTGIPIIGLVQVGSQAMADRYTYIPLTGLFIIVTWAVCELAAKFRLPAKNLKIIGIVILFVLMVITQNQLQYWRSSFTLFQQASVAVDDNYRAYYNMGLFLSKQRRSEDAAKNFISAIEIKPRWPEAHHNLGVELFKLGKLTQAIECYKTAIGLEFQGPEIYNNLGFALETQGNLDEAVKNYRLAINKAKPSSYINAHYGLATTLLKQKKTKEAIEEYDRILQINPNHVHARQQLEKLKGQ